LAEAAKSAGLNARAIDAIDATGHDRNGAEIPDLVDPAALLKAVFASDIGVDNETVNTRDGGYIWFEILAIDPARERKLDEVKADVETAWRKDQAARELNDRALDLVKRLEAGEAMDAVASSVQASVQHAALTRADTSLGPSFATRVFGVPVNGAGSVQTDGGRAVFKVLDSTVPTAEIDGPEFKTIAGEIKNPLAEDILAQYVARLQNELGVTLNQQLLQAALGRTED
jgi:peptidyl-prolyl cis-trans isomerase D